RLLHIAGDLADRRALLLDRGTHRGSELRDAVDGHADLLDGGDGIERGRLHAGDLRADVVGGLGGLRGERLHFLGDDGEAAAGGAGAPRLDGGIERQEVGLLGDGGDYLDHVADALRHLEQLVDARVGLGRLRHGVAGDLAAFVHLPADLGHRGRELVGGGRDRADAVGGLIGGGRYQAGELLGGVRGLLQRVGGVFEVGGGGEYRADDAADRAFEFV